MAVAPADSISLLLSHMYSPLLFVMTVIKYRFKTVLPAVNELLPKILSYSQIIATLCYLNEIFTYYRQAAVYMRLQYA